MKINRVMAHIAAAAANGIWAKVGNFPASQRKVFAHDLRSILLSRPLSKSDHEAIAAIESSYSPFVPSEEFAPIPIAASGLRIRGLSIVGAFDISGCRNLPALALEECIFSGENAVDSVSGFGDREDDAMTSIDLSGANLSRLSLRQSRYSFVKARNCQIDGGLDLSEAGPLSDWKSQKWCGLDEESWRKWVFDSAEAKTKHLNARKNAEEFVEDKPPPSYPKDLPKWIASQKQHCWVDLAGSQINGEVLLANSKFRAPRPRSSENAIIKRYAVQISQASVSGAIIASPSVILEGGINLANSSILGDLQFDKSILRRGEEHAFSVSGAKIRGSVQLNELTSFGCVNLETSTISGDLLLFGSFVDGVSKNAIAGDSAQIGGSVFLKWGFAAKGDVWLRGASISGGLICGGSSFFSEDGNCLTADCIDVGDEVSFDRNAIAFGTVWFRGASIGQNFTTKGALFWGDEYSLVLEDASVGKSVLLRDRFAAKGSVLLLFANVRGGVEGYNAYIDGAGKHAINAQSIKVDNEVSFWRQKTDEEPAYYFACRGPVTFQSARIAGGIDFSGAKIESIGTDEALLSFDGAHVGRSVLLRSGLTVNGMLRLFGTQVGGNLELVGARVLNPTSYAIVGRRLQVGDSLRIENNTLSGILDLSHSRIEVLSDNNEGYMGAEHLELDGLTYQSMSRPSMIDEPTKPRQISKERLKWLKKQRRYFPAPYSQLANSLRAWGYSDEARAVNIGQHEEQLRQEYKSITFDGGVGQRLLASGRLSIFWVQKLFGLTFGFGFSPNRALATLVVSFLFGWLFFSWANAYGLMIVTHQPVANVIGDEQPEVPVSDGPSVANVRCDTTIRPSLYALDVFIPLIDLRQEGKCEAGRSATTKSSFFAWPGITLPQSLWWFGGWKWLAAEEVVRYVKAIYSIFGWIVVSLSILTFSGILQRRDSQS